MSVSNKPGLTVDACVEHKSDSLREELQVFYKSTVTDRMMRRVDSQRDKQIDEQVSICDSIDR